MKVLVVLIIMSATTAFAADEILLLKNGMTFNHTIHQTEKVGICSACHDQEPPVRIPDFGKEWSHKNCIECHDIFKEGPTECRGCHTSKDFKEK